jgi:hypothetical protein
LARSRWRKCKHWEGDEEGAHVDGRANVGLVLAEGTGNARARLRSGTHITLPLDSKARTEVFVVKEAQ